MADSPLWLSREFLNASHHDQLEQHGGLAGIRDENALESALARPQHRWAYQPETSLYELAAAYGYALATSHPFSDGNKRTAFIAMYTFLGINGIDICAEQIEVVDLILRLASGKLQEKQLADWLEANSERDISL